MSVRAKFKVQSILRSNHSTSTADGIKYGELQTVKLSPVYSADKTSENYAFWEASPTGLIELGTINQAAGEQFHLGQEFYIDFTPAD